MKIGILVILVLFSWSCKEKNREKTASKETKPQIQTTNPVVREGSEHRVVIANPPINSNADKITLVVSQPDSSDAVGYRYALVSLPSKETIDTSGDGSSGADSPNVLTIIIGNKDFISKLMAEHGGKIMTEVFNDPDISAKVKNIGMKIATNQNILSSITNADGIDTAELMGYMQSVLADISKMEKAKTDKERAKHRNSILAVFGKIQKNKELSDVIIDALLQESAFIANLIREEGIISSILNKKEIIDSIMNADGGEDLKALIDIPAVISNLDNIFADMLEDSEFISLVTEPTTRTAIEKLMGYSQQLEQERKKKKKNHAKIKELNDKVNAEMLKLAANTELMSNVMGRLLRRVPNESSAPPEPVEVGGDPCEDAEYSELVDIGSRLSVELGDVGKKVLCIVGYDAEGNSQHGVSRYEWERTYAPALYFSDAGLPKPESDVSEIKITVNATDESLVGYRYLLLHDQSSCSLDFNAYLPVVKGFTTPITAKLDKAGLKLLCVYGVDSSNRIASVLNFHSWYYRVAPVAPPPAATTDQPPNTAPDTPPNTPPDTPPDTPIDGGDKTPPPVAVDYSKGLMHTRVLIASNNYYYPGDRTIKNVEIKNHGVGALSWSLRVDGNHSWLQINTGDGNWQPVRNASDADSQLGFVRAVLGVGGKQTISLRLAGDMALGMPYYREARFSIVNNATGFVSSFSVRLYIPRLLVSNTVIGFNSNNKSEQRILVLANSGSGNLQWDIVPLPSRANWWSMQISRNPNGTGMITFGLNKDKLPTADAGATYVQHFALFSNGDALGSSACKTPELTAFDGSSRVNWPTADCHDFKLLYRLD
ncbi:MAG: hypothetical protein OYH77_07275 [Pseudomonadota bacterium]|nr:hypothetical protein [Pseudomonadota bacterium]